MTIPESKLHAVGPPSRSEDLLIAEVLPLKDYREEGVGAKAYTIGYQNYHGDDIEANVVGEATVLENLGWDPETRRMFIRRVYTILAVQLLLTFTVSTFMILHVPTQTYVLTHGWPVMLSMILSIVLMIALMCKNKWNEFEP